MTFFTFFMGNIIRFFCFVQLVMILDVARDIELSHEIQVTQINKKKEMIL